MALLDGFKRKSTKVANSITSIKNHMLKANSVYKDKSARNSIVRSEYNFNMIDTVYENDSYLKISIDKYSQMLFKAGYILKSDNPKAVEYIKTRFRIMSFATKNDMDILFDEIGSDLVKYSNAFLIKGRVDTVLPGISAVGFTDKKPIGGYFRQHPSNISIKRDAGGNISHYIVTTNNGDEVVYKESDVIHLYLDREAGKDFGTPRSISALEDIELLRKIEGNVAVMIYRYSMPMYHWKVGLPETGYQATTKEIDEAVDFVNNMPLDGTIVTNEKTNISVVGANGAALNAVEYLNYFEKRTFTALDVSESQMGRGGAKQDADSMEAQAHDTVKHMQKIFSLFVVNCILNELLLEGGFNPIINEKDKVDFIFNEINIETKIKVENHEIAKYQSNVVSFKEMRRNIGEDEKVNKEELYKFYIEGDATERETKLKTEASIEIQDAAHKNAIKLAKESSKLNQNKESIVPGSGQATLGNKKVSPNGNGATKNQGANKDVSTKDNPENQHGKTSVKIKESFSELVINRSREANEERFSDIYNAYDAIAIDLNNGDPDLDMTLAVGFDNIKNLLKLELANYAQKGYSKAIEDINGMSNMQTSFETTKIYLKDFENDIDINVKEILLSVKDGIDKYNDSNIDSAFTLYRYRIRFLLEHLLPKAYWYSYCVTAKNHQITKARIIFDGSEDGLLNDEFIDLTNLDLNKIPPFHPFCDCKVRLLLGGEN